MRGRFDDKTRTYVLSDEDRRQLRKQEAHSYGWCDRNPDVFVEYWCEWCGFGEEWMSDHFYIEHGSIPVTVEDARAREYPCGCQPGSVFRLQHFSLYSPSVDDDGEPVVSWSADDG